MPHRSFLMRSALPRPAMLVLAFVLALAWSGGASAHAGHAGQADATPHVGMAAGAAVFGEIVAVGAGEEDGHEAHGHHDHAGPHGAGKCSFGCSASMLSAGQSSLPGPAERPSSAGWGHARLSGIAFRPPERPPRILG